MDAPTFIGFLFLSGLDTEEKGSRLLSHRHRAVGFVLHSLSDIERIGRNISFVPEIGRVLQHREGVVYPFADAELASLEDRKSTRLNSSHIEESRMPSSA